MDAGTRFIVADGIRNLGQEDRAGVMLNRSNAEPESCDKRLHVTATVRITVGINKAEDAGGWMPQSDSQIRCGESSQRRWPYISNFVAGFTRRPCETDIRSHPI